MLITVTDAASEKLKKYLAEKNPEAMIRLYIQGVG